MSEIFTYSYIKSVLTTQHYLWEYYFELIERVIIPSEVLIAYSKNLYNGDVKEKNIYFFLKNCIYNLIFENSKSLRIIAYNPKNILKIIIDIQGKVNATLKMNFLDEEILLSGSDGINGYQDYEYVQALLEIAKLYSN